MSLASERNYKYLIVGGTTKAATTSLFYYLADHPRVCASTMKETRFFLDPDYPITPYRFRWSDGSDKYNEFFDRGFDREFLRVEASPDYLYSSGTPLRIKEFLPDAKMIFILREPISRLISWYRFARQRAHIPERMTIDEYIDEQLQLSQFDRGMQPKKSSDSILQAYFFSTVEQGLYSRYLQPYFEVFARHEIQIIFYEDLCANPHSVLEKLCNFAELDPFFYANYNFRVFNRTEVIKNIQFDRVYRNFRSSIRKYTHNLAIHQYLREMRRWFDSIYIPLNVVAAKKEAISTPTLKRLEQYYKHEAKALEVLLGCPIPWHSEYSIAR